MTAPTKQARTAAARPHDSSAGTAARKPLEVPSTQLFGGTQAIVIHHDGERYTLRRTSKGKLILTK